MWSGRGLTPCTETARLCWDSEIMQPRGPLAVSRLSAYATASVLVISILVMNLFAYWLMQRFIAKGGRRSG